MYAKLRYLADLSLYNVEKPYTLHGFPPHVTPTTTASISLFMIFQSDVRGHESCFNLDTNGFEFYHLPTFTKLSAGISGHPENLEKMVLQYLTETITAVENILGARKVLCFDWRFRKSGGSAQAEDQLKDLENARYKALAPADLMHCDYSYDGGIEMLRLHLKESELDSILEGRYRAKIINVWRPLRAIQHTPLILCDRQTVLPSDVQEVDQVAPTRVELSMLLKYRKGQSYVWLSDQTTEEVVIFTSWDSTPRSETASHTPHGAFVNATDANLAPRESVEVRLIVMWENTGVDASL